jgi:glutaredoxin
MELDFKKNVLIKHWNYKECEKCDEVEKLFRSNDMSYSVIISDKAIFGDIMKKSGSMDVPQVIVNGEFVGGLDDFKRHLEEN